MIYKCFLNTQMFHKKNIPTDFEFQTTKCAYQRKQDKIINFILWKLFSEFLEMLIILNLRIKKLGI